MDGRYFSLKALEDVTASSKAKKAKQYVQEYKKTRKHAPAKEHIFLVTSPKKWRSEICPVQNKTVVLRKLSEFQRTQKSS